MKFLKKYRFEIIITLIYFLFFVILSWPLILHLKTQIIGLAGDPYYDIWLFESLRAHALTVNFPYGTQIPYHIITPQYPLLDLWAKASSYIAASPVARYNALIIIGFPLTGLATYLLSREFIQNKWICFFAGLIVAFSPYHLVKATHHINLANIFWIIFFLKSFIVFVKKPKVSTGILSGALFGAVLLDHYQYGFLASIMSLLMIIIVASFQENIVKYLKSTWSGILSFLAIALGLAATLAPWLFKVIAGQDVGLSRGFNYAELSVYSAQKFFYLLAPPNTILGNLFSGKYSSHLASSLGTIEEATIYFGITIFILAIIMSALAIASSKTSRDHFNRAITISLVAIFVISIFMSFAPQIDIFGMEIKTPAHYFFQQFPFFRVWSRFSLGALISGTILACVLLEKISYKYKVLVVLIAVIILIEIWPAKINPYETKSVNSDIYSLLPSGCVLAEYPFLPSDDPAAARYLLAQTSHSCSLINFAGIKTDFDNERKALLDPSNEDVINKLSARGAEYLIIHFDMYNDPLQTRKYPAEHFLSDKNIISSQLEKIDCASNDCLYKIKSEE